MMVVPFVAFLLLGTFFALVYIALYRPLFSQPYPGQIVDVIPAVANVKLTELERWLSQELSNQIADKLTPREQRIARQQRRRIIGDRLAPVEANARLCLASLRPEVRMLRRKQPGPRSERDRLTESLFERSEYCCLLLTFARVSRVLMPWDVDRMITFHRDVVLQEVRQFLLAFLRLAGAYGEHRRENLLASLDCWELDESYG